MNKIKFVLLALVASIATMAFAAQAASAAHWTDEEGALQGAADFQFDGAFVWQAGGGSIGCQVSGEAALAPGDEGQITSFDFSDCEGTEGYSACKAAGPAAVPWQITAHDDEIVTGKVAWEWTLSSKPGQSCNIKHVSFTSNELTLTPDNPAAISTLSLSGTVLANLGSGSAPSTVSGSFEVSPAGSYGVAAGLAGIWASEGAPLTEAVEVELNGRATVVDAPSIGSSFECAVQGYAELGPGGEASLTGFEYDSGDCKGSGYFAGCQLKSSAMQSAPWALQPESDGIRVEGFDVLVEWGGTCVLSGTTSETEAELVLTPDDMGAISSLALSGDSQSSTAAGLLSGEMGGELDMTPAGVYGVL